MKVQKPRGMWAPLSIGFGALLLLVTLATLVTFDKSFRIFQQLSTAHERHYRVADALQRLRADLYLAGILKRDFLLDQNKSQASLYAAQFSTIQASAETSLLTLEQALGKEQAEALNRLRQEVNAYIRPLQQALDWEPVETSALRWYLLRLQVRQRTAALAIAGDIEKLNAKALAEQQIRIADAERGFRATLVFILIATIAISIVVAGFTMFHMRRLEKHSDQVQSELRRLSQQMVKVQEAERRTISRELHDEVGQMLTGLRMELANLDGPQMQQDPADYQRLQEAKRLTERTLQTVRNLALLLRPSMLDDLGLSPAVRWHAKEFSRRSGIPVEVSIEGEVDTVPDDVRTCLYRVVQEALTNVARHAHATRIRLRMQRAGECVTAAIEDDGVGFTPARTRFDGVGLVGMQERVKELSGKLAVSSTPGKGTVIQVEIPIAGAVAC